MARRSDQPVHPHPLAYFLTWPTYGTWLPGDERGWVEYHNGWKDPDPIRIRSAESRMAEGACILDLGQRRLVEDTVRDHCRKRAWQLYAVNCRTNHLHVIVAAAVEPKQVRIQLKAWCTRRLMELERVRRLTNRNDSAIRDHWWAERGSQRWINDEDDLEKAIYYVLEAQD